MYVARYTAYMATRISITCWCQGQVGFQVAAACVAGMHNANLCHDMAETPPGIRVCMDYLEPSTDAVAYLRHKWAWSVFTCTEVQAWGTGSAYGVLLIGGSPTTTLGCSL